MDISPYDFYWERHAHAHVQAMPLHVSMDAAQHLRMWNVDLPDPPHHHFVHLAMTRVQLRISRHVTFPSDLCYLVDEEPVVETLYFRYAMPKHHRDRVDHAKYLQVCMFRCPHF
jgi:hypothetical protein